MPAVIFHSVMHGAYSTISCNVLGMKPGKIRPMPFSIHTAKNTMIQADITQPARLDNPGESNTMAAIIFIATADQIQGTRAFLPCSPKYK